MAKLKDMKTAKAAEGPQRVGKQRDVEKIREWQGRRKNMKP